MNEIDNYHEKETINSDLSTKNKIDNSYEKETINSDLLTKKKIDNYHEKETINSNLSTKNKIDNSYEKIIISDLSTKNKIDNYHEKEIINSDLLTKKKIDNYHEKEIINSDLLTKKKIDNSYEKIIISDLLTKNKIDNYHEKEIINSDLLSKNKIDNFHKEETIKSDFLTKKKIDYVIYDNKCLDSFCAAFVIWYSQTYKIKFITYDNLYKNSDVFSNKNIIMCGLECNDHFLKKILNETNDFLIIECVTTKILKLNFLNNNKKKIDENKSLCHISWNIFCRSSTPLFIRYIQDYTSGLNKYSNSYNFIISLKNEIMNFQNFKKFIDNKIAKKYMLWGKRNVKFLYNKINLLPNNIFIQEFNNKYYIISYHEFTNDDLSYNDINLNIIKKNPMIDISCVYYYDNIKNETSFHLYSNKTFTNILNILKKLNGDGNNYYGNIIIKNNNKCLPLEIINDKNILNFFNDYKKKIVLSNIKYTYVLFNKNIDISDKILDLIKMKFNDCEFIIFQYSNESEIKDYFMYFNELSTKNEISILQLTTFNSIDKVITFSSNKTLSEIFQ